LSSAPCQASFLSGEAIDTAANVLAWVVLVIVPVIGIALFWMVHVLPEKLAHRRHHPQIDAIKTLCLLSLVFGGMLWPLAWLWAFVRPTGYRMAYGTDKHDDYFVEMGRRAQAGELGTEELRALHEDLDAMARRGAMGSSLREARRQVAAQLDGTSSTPEASARGASS
jgi:hypothetical protein